MHVDSASPPPHPSRTFEKLATPLISTIKNTNFIVNKPTFPLLDAVLIRVDYVLTLRGRAVMK